MTTTMTMLIIIIILIMVMMMTTTMMIMIRITTLIYGQTSVVAYRLSEGVDLTSFVTQRGRDGTRDYCL